MQYRDFGKLDWKASALGFGAMRLPTMDGKPFSGNIDEKESIRIIRYAIDQGVNYIDTAYPYHAGNSEIVVGKALHEGYRGRVKLATKSPVWFIKSPADFDKYLNEQLARMQTDHIDFYLLHGLNRKTWENIVLKQNIIERAEAAVKDGRIGYLGFSFHDELEFFQQIVDAYHGWTFCQIQYNYMDEQNQAGRFGLLYADVKGLAVIVMEPLLGGKLANPPAPVAELFSSEGSRYSPAEWALKWLWNQPQVSMVLSGMSSQKQLEENLQSASNSCIGTLTNEEIDFIEKVRRKFEERTAIPCTKCGYCMPCIHGVNIPKNFEIYNHGFMFNDMGMAKMTYQSFLPEAERAHNCTECNQCELICPQQIPIREWIFKVWAALGQG